MKRVAKKCLKHMTGFFRWFYRAFYAKPITEYKIRHCAAINEFFVNDYYRHREYSCVDFYPAIMQKNPKRAKKIYNRIVSFDQYGIPIVDQFSQHYWPVTIIQYGLLNYNFYLSYQDEKYKQTVITICEWLINNISENGAWEHNIVYHSNVTNEDIQAPYASAMVQGEGISLLVRGYNLLHKSEYLQCAGEALKPFLRTREEVGVLEKIGNLSFYEEYPTPTPSHVLNGFMFSLFGLLDLSTVTSEYSVISKELFDEGAKTLVTLLPLFDGGFCSRYDLSHITAAPHNENKNPFYHFIHVNQLIAINSVIKSKTLEAYIVDWK